MAQLTSIPVQGHQTECFDRFLAGSHFAELLHGFEPFVQQGAND